MAFQVRRHGDAPVVLLLRLRDRLGGATFALDVDAPARLFQGRVPARYSGTAVCIYLATGITWIEQGLRHCGVSGGSTRDDDFAHELVPLVDTGVQLELKWFLPCFAVHVASTSCCARLKGIRLVGMVPPLFVSASSRLLR